MTTHVSNPTLTIDGRLSFDDAHRRLQQILGELAGDDVSIDTLEARVAEAADLIVHCRERLRGTQTRLHQITARLHEPEQEIESGAATSADEQQHDTSETISA